MSIYDDLSKVAEGLFAEFKQGDVKLIQFTDGSGTPDNPGTPIETVTAINATVRGVSFKYVMQGFAVKGDVEVTTPVIAGKTPSIDDCLEINSQRYKIIQNISSPAGQNVVWKFIARRG